ncbi:MAG: methionyl-tRNA formyltransferase [Pseudomonadota bacterium]
MRLIFMGTPDFSVPALHSLIDAGHEICAVYCQPPRPAGRGKRTKPSPVHQAAEAAGIEVCHPVSLKNAETKQVFADLQADAAVVAAYGLILPKAVLAAPRLGCLNIHASLLPRWRGAAPIQRAILAGDTETGVTIMQMEAGLDTGPMLMRGAVPIGPETTASILHDELAAMGASLIVRTLADLPNLSAEEQPDEGVTYAAKLTREDGRLAWQDASYIDRQVRALTPWPGAWFEFQDTVMRVQAVTVVPSQTGAAGIVLDEKLTIGCANGGSVRIDRLQRPGKASMATADFLRGYPIAPGSQLPLNAPCRATA